MIYVKEENVLKKYKIEVDKEKLLELKYKIINECSIIKHIKEKQREDNLTSDYDFVHIRNYSKRFIERIDNRDFYGSPLISIYEVEYDFYKEPEIIKLLEEVLNGNEEKTLELLEYEPKEEKQESLEDKLSSLLSNNDGNDEKIIYETKKMFEDYQNTKYQKSVSIYLEDVKKCIRLLFIDEISYAEYKRVCNFIYQDEEKILSNVLCSVKLI